MEEKTLPKQKSIEVYFSENNVEDPDVKAKILPEVTALIYDRNMAVVKLEKTDDDYTRRQCQDEIDELENQINNTIHEFIKK